MARAIDIAEANLDRGKFPVGCVIIYQNQIISDSSISEDDDIEINGIVHHEILAMNRMYDGGQDVDTNKAVLFCSLEPCLMCFSTILNAGIGTIVYAYEDVYGGGTTLDLNNLPPFYRDKNVDITSGVSREECLELFKIFFNNPDEKYLKGSLLVKHTLQA